MTKLDMSDKALVKRLDNYMARGRIEADEKWRELCEAIPVLRFPGDWDVKIGPPFGGAVARFLVTKGQGRVSVYADYYDRLGFMGQPYWELYPDASGDDTDRFLIDDTAGLIAGIEASLAAQNGEKGNG